MQRQDITYCDGSRWCTKFFLFKLEIAIPLETCTRDVTSEQNDGTRKAWLGIEFFAGV